MLPTQNDNGTQLPRITNVTDTVILCRLTPVATQCQMNTAHTLTLPFFNVCHAESSIRVLPVYNTHDFSMTHPSHTIWQYLLTPWCRVLLEKLTRLQLVKKFPAFHGTRRFITALTSVRHLSLS